jgi:hypothetical protein
MTMTITTRRTAVLGGLLAAAAAPLIALSTSAIAGADPNTDPIYGSFTDTWGTSDGDFGSPGTFNGVGDLYDDNYPALGNIGTLSDTSQIFGSGADELATFNETETYADVLNGVSNGDTIVQDFNGVYDTTDGGSTSTDLWSSDFFETLNSTGSLINITDDVDLFGHAFTLFDIPL